MNKRNNIYDRVKALEKEVKVFKEVRQSRVFGAAIWHLAAFLLILLGFIAFGIHEINYEQRLLKAFKAHQFQVQSLTWEQTAAIQDLNGLIDVVKPFATHREIQIIDFYRQRIWEYEAKMEKKKGKKKNGKKLTGPDTKRISGGSKPKVQSDNEGNKRKK